MVRPTRRAAGMIVGALMLFLIGTNIQSGWLFALGAMMLGAVIVGLALPRRMVRGLEIQRQAPAEAHAGTDVPVDLVVTNPSSRSRLSISIRDPHIAPATAFVPSVSGRETLVMRTVRSAARRGIVDGQPVLVGSAAPFGVGRAVRRIPAPGRTVILPRVVPVGWMPDAASASRPLDSANVHARKGAGHDFIGIREYRPGDPLRHVHWPSTARHGDLMVREFELELPRRTGIVVDTAGDSGGAESVLDLACACAASFATHVMADGQPVTLAAAIDGRIEVSSDEETLPFLAGLEAPGGLRGAEAIRAAAGPLGRMDTVIAVLPTWVDTDPTELIGAFGAYEGIEVVVVLIDTHGADGPFTGVRARPAVATDDLAHALARSDLSLFRVVDGRDLATCLEAPWVA